MKLPIQLLRVQEISIKLSREFPTVEVYLVGGVVRDLVMERPLGDVDVVVRNVPLTKLVTFLKKLGHANLVGKNFGVIKFSPKNEKIVIDIALPRTEHAFRTGGYRDVRVAYDHRLTIEKDLERRDFTCNAIALKINSKSEVPAFAKRLRTGRRNPKQIQNSKSKIQKITYYSLLTDRTSFIDPFNGIHDIKKKTIRAVGDSEVRLQEDYTRMLRALRFACQLGFQIEKSTWETIKRKVGFINKKINYRSSEAPAKSRTYNKETSRQARRVKDEYVVARELVAREFLKGMYHDPVKMLELMDKSGLLKELIPELLTLKKCKQDAKWHSEGDVWRHTSLALQLAHSFRHPKLDLGSRKKQENKKTRKQKELNSFDFLFTGFHFKPGMTMGIQETLELYLGILFHDIGKPRTAGHEKKKDSKAITYYGHEVIGAQMTSKIVERLKLSSPEEYGVSTEQVVWLVKNHMLLHPENASKMRNATLEKYFFHPDVPGKVLLGLCFFDGLASVPSSHRHPKLSSPSFSDLIGGSRKKKQTKKDLESFGTPFSFSDSRLRGNDKRILKPWPALEGWWWTIQRLQQISKGKKELPPPLLDGHEIMRILKIESGPVVGKVISALREAQLSGNVKSKKEARVYIKRIGR